MYKRMYRTSDLSEEDILRQAMNKIRSEISPEPKLVNFESLVGKHILTGCDFESAEEEEGNSIRFILDGVTYKAIENPEDGYRSTCGSLFTSYENIKNTFEPHKVTVRTVCEYDGEDESNDILEIIDDVSGQIVLRVGTDYHDSYYPCCVMQWSPLNLASNYRPGKWMK